MSNNNEVSIDLLKTKFDYNPETGIITSKRGNKPVGSDNGNGYLRIRIGAKLFYAHRVIYALYHGFWPTGLVDHRDGNKLNNKITNLRKASRGQNVANAANRARIYDCPRGVIPKGRNFQAYITHDNKRRWLGTYSTAEEAHAVYCRAANELHGEYSIINRVAA